MASGLSLQRRPIVAVSGRPTFLFYRREAACQTTRKVSFGIEPPERSEVPFVVNALAVRKPLYSNFALIVILAFSTFETGHPFSAASAYF